MGCTAASDDARRSRAIGHRASRPFHPRDAGLQSATARLIAVAGCSFIGDWRPSQRAERTLAALPRLQPLNCTACTAAVALDAAPTICINCRTVSPPPPDYAATVSLRRRLTSLSRLALRHWYVARILSSAPVRIFFVLMIFAEPLLFMVCVIDAAEYRDI